MSAAGVVSGADQAAKALDKFGNAAVRASRDASVIKNIELGKLLGGGIAAVGNTLANLGSSMGSYAIGVANPLSVYFDLHGTGADIDEVKLAHVVQEMVNLSPRGIREMLHMNRPIYVPTSSYGHFGRTPDEEKGTFTWERTDLAAALKSAFNR